MMFRNLCRRRGLVRNHLKGNDMAQTESGRDNGPIATLVQAAGNIVPALTHTAEGLVLVRTMIRNRPGCMGLLLFGVGYVIGRVVGLTRQAPDDPSGTSA